MPEPLHGCPGCATPVRRTMLACRDCWPLLPADLRDAVTRAWRHRRAVGIRDVTAAAAHRRTVVAAITWYRGRRSGATP